MKLINLDQVPSHHLVYEFRDVSWRGLVYVGLAFSGMAAFILLPKGSDLSWQAAWIPLLPALLFFLLALVRRKNAGQSWLLKSAPEGLYIHTGYSDGFALTGVPGAALFIPAEEVAGLACVLEVMRLPYRFGITRHHVSCLDVSLTCPVPESVRAHLEERQRCFRKAGKTGPFPVRVEADRLLRLGWGWVRPGARETAQQISERHPTLSPRKITYPDWDALDSLQQDLYLIVLWQMGMTTECLFLGRQYYRVCSAEVRRRMEERDTPSHPA